MYEMCVGPDGPDETLVWHVMAKEATTTLCGRPLSERVEASGAERAEHCSRCMASFAKLMTSARP